MTKSAGDIPVSVRRRRVMVNGLVSAPLRRRTRNLQDSEELPARARMCSQ